MLLKRVMLNTRFATNYQTIHLLELYFDTPYNEGKTKNLNNILSLRQFLTHQFQWLRVYFFFVWISTNHERNLFLKLSFLQSFDFWSYKQLFSDIIIVIWINLKKIPKYEMSTVSLTNFKIHSWFHLWLVFGFFFTCIYTLIDEGDQRIYF